MACDGEDSVEVNAMLGPPWYWPDSGITLTPGDRIEMGGFDSAGHMEVNWIRNLTTGEECQTGCATLRTWACVLDGLPTKRRRRKRAV